MGGGLAPRHGGAPPACRLRRAAPLARTGLAAQVRQYRRYRCPTKCPVPLGHLVGKEIDPDHVALINPSGRFIAQGGVPAAALLVADLRGLEHSPPSRRKSIPILASYTNLRDVSSRNLLAPSILIFLQQPQKYVSFAGFRCTINPAIRLGRLSMPVPDKIRQLVERMKLELHRRLPLARTPVEKEILQRDIASTDQSIDALVYQLYDLTDAEIKIVEGG